MAKGDVKSSSSNAKAKPPPAKAFKRVKSSAKTSAESVGSGDNRLLPKTGTRSTSVKVKAPNVNEVEHLPVALIDSDRKLQAFVEKNNINLTSFHPAGVGVLFQFAPPNGSGDGTISSQGNSDRVVAICIASASSNDPVVVLQLETLSAIQVIAWLKALLSNSSIVKVMHNVHRVAFWLHGYGLQDFELENLVDLQLLHETTIDTNVLQPNILQIAAACSSKSSTNLATSLHSFKSRLDPMSPMAWNRTPLAGKLLQILAQTARIYAQCYDEFNSDSTALRVCTAMTDTRWRNAVINQGRRAIWFDPEADNQPRSLECLVTAVSFDLPLLELQCEVDPLLKLLPAEYQHAIRAIDNYRAKLVDICIDCGRIPLVYTGKKQRVVLTQDSTTVSKDTIDEIIRNLGGEMRIGDDNRAGIHRQLHRISVMRSKTDEIYGLTMRVGRALRNAACALTDLLLSERHGAKSVLVLGHPGSGKTTLIRDVARCVSETMENVCIIDTSNEIGGDGLVPHACVGWARRMMVRSLEDQASVMIECVQNHTVETLIIDEIGRKAEVLAASTVRQRGPRLIASAHGDFRALIKNPDLKGLVGGSQQVLVGDVAAAKSTNKSKLQTQRGGSPVFDVIVELDHVVRGRCRIIWDVAKAVDSVLGGQSYSYETRQWDASTRGVQVLDL